MDAAPAAAGGDDAGGLRWAFLPLRSQSAARRPVPGAGGGAAGRRGGGCLRTRHPGPADDWRELLTRAGPFVELAQMRLRCGRHRPGGCGACQPPGGIWRL